MAGADTNADADSKGVTVAAAGGSTSESANHEMPSRDGGDSQATGAAA